MQERTSNKAIVAIIVVVLIATATGVVMYLSSSKNNQSSNSTTNTSQGSRTTDADAKSYKNGTYSASGTYQSPGGNESINVSVTLKDGAITDTSATTQAASGTSQQYQSEFVNNYKTLVVGKSINDVNLSRVAGSSLTSGGFNQAIEQIKADARA